MRLGRTASATILMVLAGCGSGTADPSVSEPITFPSQHAPTVTPDAPTPTPTEAASSPTPSTSPSPLATTEPSAEPIGTVRIPFAGREMDVAIVGQQGIVVAWRGATDRELDAVVWNEEADIGLGRLSDPELVLGWIGTVCDVEATLTVSPGSLVVAPRPRQGCDAMAVGRGMVLTFATPVDPVDIEIRLMDTDLLPESN